MTRMNELQGQLDLSDMISDLRTLPSQIREGFGRVPDIGVERPSNIVFCGMGGSGIGGRIISSWLSDRLPVPVTVVNGYSLPRFVDEGSLVFTVSYSGNTEETLTLLNQAVERGSRIVGLTSGGKMAEVLARNGHPFFEIPSGMQPRAAVGYTTLPVAGVLQGMGLIDVADEVDATVKHLRKLVNDLVPTSQNGNRAVDLAVDITGHIPFIYSSPGLGCAAFRWMTQLNENSKVLASWGCIPEMNHNEIVGWHGDPRGKEMVVVLLRGMENRRESIRFDALKEMLSEGGVRTIEVEAGGEATLTKIYHHIMLADFTSYYLALLRGIDPSPVEAIQRLKSILAQNE